MLQTQLKSLKGPPRSSLSHAHRIMSIRHIEKIIFRFFDLHDINIEVKEKEFKLRPGKSEQLKLLKQGTLKRVEVIPVTFKEDFEIVCREKMAFTDIINEC